MEKILLFGAPEKMIMDPVHGAIHLFDHEVSVVDNPLFQRLKFVLQNDVVFMVFPGCMHNRFFHSLGTMHLAAKFYRKLTVELIKRGLLPDLSPLQIESIQYIYKCVRLAALLHDTGHSPFSHQFEHIPRVVDIYNSAEFVRDAFKEIPLKHIFGRIPTTIKHEHLSIRSALKILLSIDELDVNIEDVLYFLEGTNINISDKLRLYAHTFIGILPGQNWELKVDERHISPEKIITDFLKILKNIISGEVDADKMDYILRDSYYSGVTYGKYNLDHLINNFRFGYELNYAGEKLINARLSLAINEKGLGALEDFIYARFQLYQELYNHKSVSGFRKLLELSLDEVLKSDEHLIRNYLTDADLFIHFTDTFFWEKFREILKQDPTNICGRIVFRRKLNYILKLEGMGEDDVKFECEKRSKELGKKIVYWKSSIKFSSINEVYNDIKVLTKDIDGKLHLHRITEVTDFFEKFKKEEIYHLFTFD